MGRIIVRQVTHAGNNLISVVGTYQVNSAIIGRLDVAAVVGELPGTDRIFFESNPPAESLYFVQQAAMFASVNSNTSERSRCHKVTWKDQREFS